VTTPILPALDEFLRPFLVPPGGAVDLARDHDPGYTTPGLDKAAAEDLLSAGAARLAEYQAKLYAQNIHGLLVVIQGMDAAGKDGTIQHVMSGVNPQGCQVFSFKVPSAEEMDHDYLWRFFKALPERGRIGIFNRSYYEDVLVVRVHPQVLGLAQLPAVTKNDPDLWQQRFDQINAFERYLVDNSIHVLKFHLHMSKAEQKKRFLARIAEPDKNWKFSAGDVRERGFWDDYMRAYQEVLRHTSTEWAPWYVIPADHKWFTHLAVAAAISGKMMALAPEYPTPSAERLEELRQAKALLAAETDGAGPR
jgi:PPK2 family polyphosphate:nucleotide phosphotransferase